MLGDVMKKRNKELTKYFDILCNRDYPFFIDKYLELDVLKRLREIDQFCGCFYTKIHNNKYWYSRLDHSIACALMAWNFTKDKKQTLAALFHDIGTPVFSHCIDYLLKDPLNQESSELEVSEMLKKSKQLKVLLEEDSIKLEDILDVSIYPVLENKAPMLCVDRLDGILHTVLVWIKTWNIDEIKDIYTHIVILENEKGIFELGFDSVSSAVRFFEAIFDYSMILQKNEDKFTVQFIADTIQKLIEYGDICFDDLYKLSEEEVIKRIMLNNNLKKSFEVFVNADEVIKSDSKPAGYHVSVASKKKYVIPLCLYDNEIVRVDKVSVKVETLLSEYLNYNDALYCYVDAINL